MVKLKARLLFIIILFLINTYVYALADSQKENLNFVKGFLSSAMQQTNLKITNQEQSKIESIRENLKSQPLGKNLFDVVHNHISWLSIDLYNVLMLSIIDADDFESIDVTDSRYTILQQEDLKAKTLSDKAKLILRNKVAYKYPIYFQLDAVKEISKHPSYIYMISKQHNLAHNSDDETIIPYIYHGHTGAIIRLLFSDKESSPF